MRTYVVAALAAWGCSSPTTTGTPTEPDPKGWTITVDMARLDRYVQPADTARWTIAGAASATEGLASIDVAGMPVAIGPDGGFASEVAVVPGLTRVSVLARDEAGHERKGDRTLLASRMLAAGAYNPTGASLVLDNAILSAMGGGLASQAGDIDVAGEIMSRQVLSQDDRCVTWPVSASQGTVAVRLVEDRGNLWLSIRIPNLYVYFEGSCRGALSTIPIGGEMSGTIDVWTRLTAKPPADGGCTTAFAHTAPQVQVTNWGFDVWGLGGPLQNWIVSMFSGEKSSEARAQIASEVGARANTLLAQKLANISVFDRASELALLDQPVALQLCLGGLDKVGTRLVARIAAAAAAPSPRDDKAAPGAPQPDGALPDAAPGELVLDAGLVGQLLFASWQAGGLTRAAPDADISVLHILVPELAKHHPTTTAQVTIDAELPPVVTATPQGPGELRVDLGDLMVDLTVDGTRVFRFGVSLALALDLAADGGKLVPTVIDATAEVALLDERFDGPDAAIEQGVAVQLSRVATQLIGADAAIALPDLPGLGAPTAVAVDPGGRFLRVALD